MFEDLPTLMQLLKSLQQVPYLASRNLYRVASHFLQMDQARAEQFCKIVLQAKENVVQCDICFCWREKDRACSFCAHPKRDQSLVCVIETWQEMIVLEQTRGYNGVYHVLGGVVCPLDGIGPEDLTIDQLVKRVELGTIKEIILATSQTPEGEATAAYIARKLKDKPIMVSCLARGLPVGSSLGAMDRLTVYKALSERRPF